MEQKKPKERTRQHEKVASIHAREAGGAPPSCSLPAGEEAELLIWASRGGGEGLWASREGALCRNAWPRLELLLFKVYGEGWRRGEGAGEVPRGERSGGAGGGGQKVAAAPADQAEEAPVEPQLGCLGGGGGSRQLHLAVRHQWKWRIWPAAAACQGASLPSHNARPRTSLACRGLRAPWRSQRPPPPLPAPPAKKSAGEGERRSEAGRARGACPRSPLRASPQPLLAPPPLV